ncbi:hypothetical protein FRB99_001057 [Tulasnella sp. 403]|nr:hypothetical protein FRB99_001057 [Tulasnella sp. 403]
MQATLVATNPFLCSVRDEEELASSVPSPFPRDILAHFNPRVSITDADRVAHEPPQQNEDRSSADVAVPEGSVDDVRSASAADEATAEASLSSHQSLDQFDSEIQPSLDYLRESCLSALLNLFPQNQPADGAPLFASSSTSPIIAFRRHSEPPSASAPSASGSFHPQHAESSKTPLQQLVDNLRSRDPLVSASDGESLMQEIERRLPIATAASLQGLGAELALSLMSLLIHVEKLSDVLPAASATSVPRSKGEEYRHSLPVSPRAESGRDFYETLGQRVLTVKSQRLNRSHSMQDVPSDSHASEVAQQLWDQINKDMETVLRVCGERSSPSLFSPAYTPASELPTPNLRSLEEPSQMSYFDHLPPEYDYHDFGPLPEYHPLDSSVLASSKSKSDEIRRSVDRNESSRVDSPITSEKMRMDLESIASAIDRLYLVAPQLHNQRVELKTSKIVEMERARRSGSRLRNATSESALEFETAKLVGRGRIINQTAEPTKRFSEEIRRHRLDLKGKGKARHDTPEALRAKGQDLDRILDLIGKSSSEERRISNQRVELGDFKARMEKAKLKDAQRKEQLVEQMLRHSAGRLSSQDAIHSRRVSSMTIKPAQQESEALLTLPEFIKESMPLSSLSKTLDPKEMLSLPEFFKEQQMYEASGSSIGHLGVNRRSSTSKSTSSGSSTMAETPSARSSISRDPKSDGRKASAAPQSRDPVALIKKFARNRSNSAPPLALSWFKPMYTPMRTSQSQRSEHTHSDVAVVNHSRTVLEVLHVSEYQQNLHTVQVYIRISSSVSMFDVEFEVLPTEDSALVGSDKFVVRAGTLESPLQTLPIAVMTGLQEVKPTGDHFEVKLTVPPLAQSSARRSNGNENHLMDASQITVMQPTSFVCSSCSLPIVQSTKIKQYLDLPSEHWSELIDVWMCHADQKLTEAISQQASGNFWPTRGRAFVGGSYLLFDEGAIVKNSLNASTNNESNGDWSLARCLCGAVVGRSQKAHEDAALTYRLAKYALRPISPSAEFPLSAFVVADMLELQQAHATHRFIIKDEEESKPRILLWLFNPSVRLSYESPTRLSLPSESSIHAAKVFYTLIGPSSPLAVNHTKIIKQYPAFTSAEAIFYPMDVCRRLAAMLKESNDVYPPARRSMMQLDVGWLQRA